MQDVTANLQSGSGVLIEKDGVSEYLYQRWE